jgi:hypothetical protein
MTSTLTPGTAWWLVTSSFTHTAPAVVVKAVPHPLLGALNRKSEAPKARPPP